MSTVTNHNEPYRQSDPPIDPSTDGELSFWEQVYVAVASIPTTTHNTCVHEANYALEARRKQFGVR